MGVGVSPQAAVGAEQLRLPPAGALLLAAGALAVQGLRLGRVPAGATVRPLQARSSLPPPPRPSRNSHGEGPTGPAAVIHGDPRGAVAIRNLPGDREGAAGHPGLVARDAWGAARRRLREGLHTSQETHRLVITLRLDPGAPPLCLPPRRGPGSPPARPLLTFPAAAIGHEGDGALEGRTGGQGVTPGTVQTSGARARGHCPSTEDQPSGDMGTPTPSKRTHSQRPRRAGSPGGSLWGRSRGR